MARSPEQAEAALSPSPVLLVWAADEGLIDRSPLARIKEPSREVREIAVSPEEDVRVVAAIKELRFRKLIELS